jgi:hypothetical protein
VKKVPALSVSILIFLIYFVYATKGQVYTVFTVLFPYFHVVAAVLIIVCGNFFSTLSKSNKSINVPDKIEKTVFYVLPVAVFLICALLNLFFIVSPQPEDGVHYVWLSKLIGMGSLYMDLPHFYEHHSGSFMFVQEGRFISVFLPGFSFFMAPFTKLGISFLLNPFIAGINTYLVGKHGMALKDRVTGIIAMVFFAFSTTHLMHGALYFPHHFGLMLVLISSYFVLHKEKNIKNMIIAGFVLSISLFIRPQNAVYAYFAIVVFMIFKDRNIKRIVFFTLPFLFTGSLLMFYNWFFSGNPFVFVQDLYFNPINIRKFCHRPGFGKGCNQQIGFGNQLPPEGVTLSFATAITFVRLNNFLFRITAHPLLLLFVFPAVIKNSSKYFLYYFIPLCAVVAYFTFFIEGSYWGARYLFESGALFLIVSACGFRELYQFLKESEKAVYNYFAGALTGLLVAVVISFSIFVIPDSLEKNESVYDLQKIKDIVKEKNIENSIVLLPFRNGFVFASNLSFHHDPPHDKFGNLVVNSLGISDQNIQKFYKDTEYKEIWKFERNGNEFKAEKLPFLEDDGKYGFIFATKSIPVRGSPKYISPVMPHFPNDFFSYQPDPEIEISTVAFGILFEGGDENYYGFEHSVKRAGDYEIKTAVIETECIVDFDVKVNGKNGAHFEFERDKDKLTILSFTAPLKAGRNSFTIVPNDNGCLVLDYMLMSRVE